MAASFPRGQFVLLDACCVLNLYATQRIEEILNALPCRFAVAERVAAEALYVRRGGSDESAQEREPVDLQPLVMAGLLEILQLETEDEEANFVQFAAQLDDGEAMTCALAVHRGAAVATDDRKAITVLRKDASQVDVYTTADLIKSWAETVGVAKSDLKRVLGAVRERARFSPGKHDRLQAWWQDMADDP